MVFNISPPLAAYACFVYVCSHLAEVLCFNFALAVTCLSVFCVSSHAMLPLVGLQTGIVAFPGHIAFSNLKCRFELQEIKD